VSRTSLLRKWLNKRWALIDMYFLSYDPHKSNSQSARDCPWWSKPKRIIDRSKVNTNVALPVPREKAPVNHHFYHWRLNSFDFVFKIKNPWNFILP
jgi:hypothetical protein